MARDLRPVDWSTRDGYDETFLGVRTPVPVARPAVAADLLVVDGRRRLDYTHFSVAMSRSRCLARWVAWNIYGSRLVTEPRGEWFDFDPRLKRDQQIGDNVYTANELDRGHIARRADVTWGDADKADDANRDSFYFPNIVPQMDGFNRASKDGAWGHLEDALLRQVDDADRRVCVLGGPVLADRDPVYRKKVQIPLAFWKLLLYRHRGKVCYRAFRLEQKLDGLRPLFEFPDFAPQAVNIAELERLTGLEFGRVVAQTDQPRPLVAEEAAVGAPIRSAAKIDW